MRGDEREKGTVASSSSTDTQSVTLLELAVRVISHGERRPAECCAQPRSLRASRASEEAVETQVALLEQIGVTNRRSLVAIPLRTRDASLRFDNKRGTSASARRLPRSDRRHWRAALVNGPLTPVRFGGGSER